MRNSWDVSASDSGPGATSGTMRLNVSIDILRRMAVQMQWGKGEGVGGVFVGRGLPN
jgi:hypothetical protein